MRKGKDSLYARYIKRIFDVIISLVCIVLFWWVYVIVAIAVRVNLGAPILYVAERPGKNGKLFKLYKFRSMSNDKDEYGNLLPKEKRTSHFGSVLRATSLDEIPELFINVLKGDMSLIGPRPLEKYFLPYYTESEMHRHDVLPGITGLAQVNGRNMIDWEKRFEYDLFYVNNLSFKMDVAIVFKTIKKVILKSDIVDTSNCTEIDFPDYRENQRKNAEAENLRGEHSNSDGLL